VLLILTTSVRSVARRRGGTHGPRGCQSLQDPHGAPYVSETLRAFESLLWCARTFRQPKPDTGLRLSGRIRYDECSHREDPDEKGPVGHHKSHRRSPVRNRCPPREQPRQLTKTSLPLSLAADTRDMARRDTITGMRKTHHDVPAVVCPSCGHKGIICEMADDGAVDWYLTFSHSCPSCKWASYAGEAHTSPENFDESALRCPTCRTDFYDVQP
jgi:ssDNA-binding Zn-finger/Zn-ribbon topoisomerase 1